MNKTHGTFTLALCAMLAGCAGSSGSIAGSTLPRPVPSVAPTTTPTPAPTTAPSGVLATANIDGGPAFVNASQHAVYVFSGDTAPNQSNCTGSCAAAWPPVPPPSGSLPSPWAAFKRGDGTMQLSYKGKPLYTFVNDTSPLVANGNGVDGFSLARP